MPTLQTIIYNIQTAAPYIRNIKLDKHRNSVKYCDIPNIIPTKLHYK